MSSSGRLYSSQIRDCSALTDKRPPASGGKSQACRVPWRAEEPVLVPNDNIPCMSPSDELLRDTTEQQAILGPQVTNQSCQLQTKLKTMFIA